MERRSESSPFNSIVDHHETLTCSVWRPAVTFQFYSRSSIAYLSSHITILAPNLCFQFYSRSSAGYRRYLKAPQEKQLSILQQIICSHGKPNVSSVRHAFNSIVDHPTIIVRIYGSLSANLSILQQIITTRCADGPTRCPGFQFYSRSSAVERQMAHARSKNLLSILQQIIFRHCRCYCCLL